MVNWDAATDRKLLLLALKQLNGSLDYARLKTDFGHDVTENTLRIRMHNLRKIDGVGSPTKVKSGRVAKALQPKKNPGKAIKAETTSGQESWPHDYQVSE